MQAKLLRVLQTGELERVGGNDTIRVDVRVLAATRRELDREVQLGRFRDDLYHRLAVARIELPPLRDRHGDVELLARAFWEQMGGDRSELPRTLLRSWGDYAWPGNVRELRNAVIRRLALGEEGEVLAPPATNPAVHRVNAGGDATAAVLALGLPLAEARQRVVADFEARYTRQILDEHDGNVTRAAAAAGVARRHFQRLKSRLDDDD